MNSPVASVKLTSKHQLTVPAKVVRHLQLRAGDRLNYRLVGDTLILQSPLSVKQQLADVHALTTKANKGVASDASIKQTLTSYHRQQTKRP